MQKQITELTILILLCLGLVHCGAEAPPSDSGAAEAGWPRDAGTDQAMAVDSVAPGDTGKGPTTVAPFQKGANILFIGHSFFVPAAKAYNQIATHADHKSKFPKHVFDSEFSGGASGAPGALWANAGHKKSITNKLSSGKVEVLAMTAHLTKSDQKDYQNWIDTARGFNNKTQFLISCPWPTGGPGKTAAQFEQENEALADILFKVVASLRKANPGVTIHYLNHGRVATTAKSRFDQGKLKSAQKACCGSEHLFRDTFGHGGNIIVNTSGLFFLHYLTGLSGSLGPNVYPKLNPAEMMSMVKEAMDHNKSKGYLP